MTRKELELLAADLVAGAFDKYEARRREEQTGTVVATLGAIQQTLVVTSEHAKAEAAARKADADAHAEQKNQKAALDGATSVRATLVKDFGLTGLDLSDGVSFASFLRVIRTFESDVRYSSALPQTKRAILQILCSNNALLKTALLSVPDSALVVATDDVDKAFLTPIPVVWHIIARELSLGPYPWSQAPSYEKGDTAKSFLRDVMTFRTVKDPLATDFVELTAHLCTYFKSPDPSSDAAVKFRRIVDAKALREWFNDRPACSFGEKKQLKYVDLHRYPSSSAVSSTVSAPIVSAVAPAAPQQRAPAHPRDAAALAFAEKAGKSAWHHGDKAICRVAASIAVSQSRDSADARLPVTATVDTAAAVNVIDRATADSARCVVNKSFRELSGAVAGHRFVARGTTSISVDIGGATLVLPNCYVVDNLCHQLIIGGGTLLEYNASIHAVNGQWHVGFAPIAGGVRVPADRVPIGDIRRAPAEVTRAPRLPLFTEYSPLLWMFLLCMIPSLSGLPMSALPSLPPSDFDPHSLLVFNTPAAGRHSLFVVMPDGRPAFEVHGVGDDGRVSAVDVARGVWASDWYKRFESAPPQATVAAIGTPSSSSASGASAASHSFASPVDEMMHNINFDAIDMRADERESFRAQTRAQLSRLFDHDLLIGKSSPGRKFPKAMHNVEHTISLCADADLRKVNATWHRYAPDAINAMNETFDGLRKAGIVRDVTGPNFVANAPLVVPKYDSVGRIVGQRVVIDFRALNSICNLDRYPMPLVSDVLNIASRGKYRSKLDMSNMYYQVPLRESDQYLTTTLTPTGRVVFNRMPIGLSSATATAQRVADSFFFVAGKRVCYIDDLVDAHIDSSPSALLRDLTDIVDRSIEHNVTWNAHKSVLFARSAHVLGHHVSEGRVQPITERLATLHDWPRPASKNAALRFVQTAGFYRNFIPNFAQLSAPIFELQKRYVRWDSSTWTKELDDSFNALKAAMLKHASTSEFDSKLPTFVYTDASGSGLSYLVTQLGADGHERTIVMGGRKLLKFERNYEVHERELLAMRELTKRFPHYLIASGGVPFTWRTDNRTCSLILSSPTNFNSRSIAKFATQLQSWPMRVELISAERNCVADAISRIWDDDHAPSFNQPPSVCPIGGCDSHGHDDDDEVEEVVLLSSENPMPPTPQLIPAALADDDDSSPSVVKSAVVDAPPATSMSPVGSTATTAFDSPTFVLTPQATAGVLPTSAPAATRTAVEVSSAAVDEPPIRPSTLPMRPALRGWREAQLRDESLRDLWRAAQGDVKVPHRIKRLQPCIGDYGILYVRNRRDPSQTLIVVPKERVSEMLVAAHNGLDGGHAGVRGSKYIASQSSWWPTMDGDIANHCKNCLVCQSFRDVPLNAAMGRPETNVARFEVLHVDAIPMSLDDDVVSATKDYKGIWVLKDRATGFTKLVPYEARTTSGAVAAIKSWIGLFDTPRVLQFDCAVELRSNEMKAFAESHGIQTRSGSAQNQQSNGIAESAVGRVKRQLLLAGKQATPQQWMRALAEAERTINRAYSHSRGASPFELMFGTMPHLAIKGRLGIETFNAPLPETKAELDTYKAELGAHIVERVDAANAMRAAVQASNAAHYEKIGVVKDIKVSDYVMMANEAETEKTAIENKQRQAGPFKVVSIDAREKRAVLQRLAGAAGELDRPVSTNRLQVIPKSMVENGVKVGDEPGATAFAGPSDATFLLSGDRKKVDKEEAKAEQARLAEEAKAEKARLAEEAKATKARLAAEKKAAVAKAREEAEQQRRADAAAKAEAKALSLKRMLAVVVPPDVVPTKMARFADGTFYFVPLDNFPDGGVWIGRRHARFNDIEHRYLARHQKSERSARASRRQLRPS